MDLYIFGILFVDFGGFFVQSATFSAYPSHRRERPPCRSPMTAGAEQKDQPPNYHVIARRAKPDVAIPWSTEHPGESTGLPRRLSAPRNDVVVLGWVVIVIFPTPSVSAGDS